MKKLIFLFFLTTLIISCKEEKKEVDPSVAMMKEVLSVHDEVMPKMTTIKKLVDALQPKVDSTEQGLLYEKAMNDLKASNKEMMDWMSGFSNRFEPDEIGNNKELTTEKKRWLKEEKQKVEALKQNVEVSIAEAEALLNDK